MDEVVHRGVELVNNVLTDENIERVPPAGATVVRYM